jgi:hypothetical protein
MKEDCDMSASGNVKGRKPRNTNLRGKVICKWILNVYLLWAATLNITGHISGPLAGSHVPLRKTVNNTRRRIY